MKFTIALIFLFLIFPVSYVIAHGEVNDFSTDKKIYHKNDQLNISGNVEFDSNVPFVTIQIFTPGKSGFADFKTFPIGSDGKFSAVFHVGGPTWTAEGNYPIKVTYNGNIEKTIQYKEFAVQKEQESVPEPEVQQEPAPEPEVQQEPAPEPEVQQEPVPEPEVQQEPVPEPEVQTRQESNFITLKFKIPNFPSFDKPPQYYIDRYNNEQSYKKWFDSQFPNDSIVEVVGYKATKVADFPSFDKPPQYYIDRYNNEQSYKKWFDSQFPNDSIYNVLGYKNPIAVPDWIRNNAEWWAIGEINDSTFVSGIEFMLENDIIRISSISPSGNVSDDEIPSWIRNNAHWWSQDLISEDEFVNSLKFLIQNRVITVN